MLEILQARDHVSGAELAERLEVDIRTVQRYIVRLQDLSIPVESVRGVGGHYRLRPGFRLPPLMFTDEEAFALSLGLRALRQLGLSAFAPAAEGASAKLERVLPQAIRESVQTFDEVVAIEPAPWVVTTSAEFLIRTASAIRLCRRIDFAYCSRAGDGSQRQIEPYGLVHTDGRWYLVGRCLFRKALRTFRLDRVSKLQVCPDTFERPSSFDARSYLQARKAFVEFNFQIDAWIDMPIAEAQQAFAPWHVATEEANGGTRVRCSRDRLQLLAAILLSFDRRVVVREPPELRETFAKLAHRAMQATEQPVPFPSSVL